MINPINPKKAIFDVEPELKTPSSWEGSKPIPTTVPPSRVNRTAPTLGHLQPRHGSAASTRSTSI